MSVVKPKTQADILQEQASAQAAEQLRQEQEQLRQQQSDIIGQQMGQYYAGKANQTDSPNPQGIPLDQLGQIKPSVNDATTATQTAAPTEQQPTAFMDWYNGELARENERHKQESDELARRSRAREAIGSIADASSALANLIFTGQTYAPDMYDPKNSMNEKAYERYLRAKKELDKTHTDNMAFLERQAKVKNEANKQEYNNRMMDWRFQNLELSRQRLEQAKDLKEKEFLLRQYIAELKRQKDENDWLYKQKLIDLKTYQANTARINAQTNALEAQGYIKTTSEEKDPLTGATDKTEEKRPIGSDAQPATQSGGSTGKTGGNTNTGKPKTNSNGKINTGVAWQ